MSFQLNPKASIENEYIITYILSRMHQLYSKMREKDPELSPWWGSFTQPTVLHPRYFTLTGPLEPQEVKVGVEVKMS